MTIGTDLADEITANETTGLIDPVHTPVQYGHDLVDVLGEMKPVMPEAQGKASIAAQYPFSAKWKRGRIETGRLFRYQGATFATCIVKSNPHQFGTNDCQWWFTVFVREHVGTRIVMRKGRRVEQWTWRYHHTRSFRSSVQAYDLFERLEAAFRNEQELDDPYRTQFMGPEAPWDPHVLSEMIAAQEERDRASEAHASVDWDSIDWHTTVIADDRLPQ